MIQVQFLFSKHSLKTEQSGYCVERNSSKTIVEQRLSQRLNQEVQALGLLVSVS